MGETSVDDFSFDPDRPDGDKPDRVTGSEGAQDSAITPESGLADTQPDGTEHGGREEESDELFGSTSTDHGVDLLDPSNIDDPGRPDRQSGEAENTGRDPHDNGANATWEDHEAFLNSLNDEDSPVDYSGALGDLADEELQESAGQPTGPDVDEQLAELPADRQSLSTNSAIDDNFMQEEDSFLSDSGLSDSEYDKELENQLESAAPAEDLSEDISDSSVFNDEPVDDLNDSNAAADADPASMTDEAAPDTDDSDPEDFFTEAPIQGLDDERDARAADADSVPAFESAQDDSLTESADRDSLFVEIPDRSADNPGSGGNSEPDEIAFRSALDSAGNNNESLNDDDDFFSEVPEASDSDRTTVDGAVTGDTDSLPVAEMDAATNAPPSSVEELYGSGNTGVDPLGADSGSEAADSTDSAEDFFEPVYTPMEPDPPVEETVAPESPQHEDDDLIAVVETEPSESSESETDDPLHTRTDLSDPDPIETPTSSPGLKYTGAARNSPADSGVMKWFTIAVPATLLLTIVITGAVVFHLQSEIDEVRAVIEADQDDTDELFGDELPGGNGSQVNDAVIENINARIDNIADTLALVVNTERVDSANSPADPANAESVPPTGIPQAQIEETVTAIIKGNGEIRQLTDRIDTLAQSVDRLERTREVATKPATRSRPAKIASLQKPPAPVKSTRPEKVQTSPAEKPVKTVQKAATRQRSDSGSRADKAGARNKSSGPWVVNLMSLNDRKVAQQQQARFSRKGVDTVIVPAKVKGKQWYRVRVVGFKTRKQAKKYADSVQTRLSLAGTWVTR